MSRQPWLVAADGVVIDVRLTPKGGRDAVDGIERLADGRAVIKARVRAAPSDGEANAALAKLIARTLRVAPSKVTLIAGATARIKRLKVAGDAPALTTLLEHLTGVSK